MDNFDPDQDDYLNFGKIVMAIIIFLAIYFLQKGVDKMVKATIIDEFERAISGMKRIDAICKELEAKGMYNKYCGILEKEKSLYENIMHNLNAQFEAANY